MSGSKPIATQGRHIRLKLSLRELRALQAACDASIRIAAAKATERTFGRLAALDSLGGEPTEEAAMRNAESVVRTGAIRFRRSKACLRKGEATTALRALTAQVASSVRVPLTALSEPSVVLAMLRGGPSRWMKARSNDRRRLRVVVALHEQPAPQLAGDPPLQLEAGDAMVFDPHVRHRLQEGDWIRCVSFDCD